MPATPNVFSRALQAALDEQQWSAARLAEASGVHKTMISRLLHGQRRPTIPVLHRLARGLCVEEAEYHQMCETLAQAAELTSRPPL